MVKNAPDIKMHFEKDVNLCVKLAFKEFRKWLKTKMIFAITINVYVTNTYRVTTKNHVEGTGIFGTPSSKNKYPYIKLATSDFEELKNEIGYYNGMMSILHTFAHEIVHYKQWIDNKAFREKLADKEATKLVNEYTDYKMGFLTANRKTLSLIEKAYDYYDKENFISAIDYFSRVVLPDSELELIFKDLGNAYSALCNYEQAIQYYDKALDLNKIDYDLYVNKGYSLDKLFRFEESSLCYDYAIALNPKDEIAYLNKGYSLLCSDKLMESIKYFDKVIEINPEYEDAYIFKAQIYEKLSDYDNSIQAYDKAININPSNMTNYIRKGRILYLIGKYEECIEAINRKVQIKCLEAEAYYYLALSYIKLDRIEDCIINLKKSIEFDRNYKNIAQSSGLFNSIINLIDCKHSL